jgi:hypothetical protein
VSQLQYNHPMKTATLPPVRIAPAFRAELESVLQQGETLSQFVEAAVRNTMAQRQSQVEFIRRGLAAIAQTQATGDGIPADAVIARLRDKLAVARGSRGA